jgi:hypothetical protein
MAIKIQHCVRTLRLKVKAEGYGWLNAAAIEVNQVWNFSNATSYKAMRPFSGRPRWLTPGTSHRYQSRSPARHTCNARFKPIRGASGTVHGVSG